MGSRRRIVEALSGNVLQVEIPPRGFGAEHVVGVDRVTDFAPRQHRGAIGTMGRRLLKRVE